MTLTALLHRIVGAPDYQAYLDHMRRCHPEDEPLSEAAFFQQRLNDRYNRVGTRCC
jgi:uncharacterized short protein YbdD (DUF466 family)